MDYRFTVGVCAAAIFAIAPETSAQPSPAVAPADPSAQAQAGSPEQKTSADGGGKVVIRCTVAPQYKLDACVVVGEDPPNAGFGEMALKLSKEMRIQGPPGATGGTLTIPITFKPDRKRRGGARPRLGLAPIKVQPAEK